MDECANQWIDGGRSFAIIQVFKYDTGNYRYYTIN